jgi:hypothetical protein
VSEIFNCILIVFIRDRWLIETNFFSRKNFHDDAETFLNKHVDQIIETKTKSIQISETQQERNADEYDAQCDQVDENDSFHWINEESFIDFESKRIYVVFIQKESDFADSLQSRELFDFFWRLICCVVIDK